MARPSSTSSPLGTVRSVLNHELRLGCNDRATVGGLVGFWRHWLPRLEAAADEADRRALREATDLIAGYGEADQAGRAALIASCLALLDRLGAPRAPGDASRLGQRPPAARPEASGRPAARPEATGRAAGSGEPLRPAPAEAPDRSSRPTARPVARESRPPGPAPARAGAGLRRATGDLDSSVTALPGIGPTNAERLGRLGLKTIRDLLYYFPTRHIDYRDVKNVRDLRDLGDDAYQTVLGSVVDVKVDRLRGRASPAGQWLFADMPPRRGRPGLLRIVARVRDHTGTVEAVWLRPQDYISREFTPGRQVILSGQCKAKWHGDELEFADPDYEFLGGAEAIHTARLVPVYRRTQNIGERWLRKVVKQAVDTYAHQLVDHLPAAVRKTAGLLELATAVAQIHFPDSPELLERARTRLTFDELFIIQLGVLDRRREWQGGPPSPALDGGAALRHFLESLPYALTGAQRRVLDEIVKDLGTTRPMSRLLQGEVGSGKTVVAAGAALVAMASGYQAAIMAPTEVLAEQHFRSLSKLYGEAPRLSSPAGDRPVRLGLLVGSLKRAEKQAIYRQIARGEVDLVVGTHALIQEGVEFARLGLAIVDEQHRFGVLQRTALRQKGASPHLLVMTATPIPRTLALTLYGDLDLSVIDELPPGRQEIRTKCFGPRERPAVYEGLRQEVRAGRQAFIICPLVEESEKLEAKAATAEYERLREEVFPDLRLGLVHGRMKPAEKERVMREFQRGELDVLVATAVVEVGIDVPNATCMIIEGADRFGLAQLHQFRGRVGRGSERSYCALLSESTSEAARERLEVVASTRDGFKLAEEDLKLRGPGEFFGTRQSGLPDLKLARASDGQVLEQARTLAIELFERDAGLSAPEHRLLAERVAQLWRPGELN